jgi:hypothetical protein
MKLSKLTKDHFMIYSAFVVSSRLRSAKHFYTIYRAVSQNSVIYD